MESSCAMDLRLVSSAIEMVSCIPPKMSKDLYCSGAGAIEQLQDTSSFIWYILLAWVFSDASRRFVVVVVVTFICHRGDVV